MSKTRRLTEKGGVLKPDAFYWEIIHWLTMTFFRVRIVRGYNLITGELMRVFIDRASNWSSEGEDWHRLDVPYPKPLWSRYGKR